jgi:predicted nucleotidyltransferase
MSFSPQEVNALETVVRGLPATDIVLVGAAALRTTGRFTWRTTSDLDLTVALDDDEYPARLSEIAELRQDINVMHRWWKDDVKIDILPAGPELRRAGYFTSDGHKLSLLGFHLAFEHSISLPIDNFSIRVAPPPVISILKMTAYADRPAERERDLQDIAYLLEEYISDDDERRFADRVVSAGILWEHVSAHELGYDIGRIVGEREERIVSDFLLRLRNSDTDATLQRMLRSAPPRWRKDEVVLVETCTAFTVGFHSGRGV